MQEVIPITDVYAREILDSRGNPTLEVEVLAGRSFFGRASVPSGASTGKYEARELRDLDMRYHGKGVQKAADHVNRILAQEIIGMDVREQAQIDRVLCKKDGTGTKENLGANAILGVSMAVAKAGAASSALPLYRYLGGASVGRMPIPMMNIVNGGRHADNFLDFQEFMILPDGAKDFKEAVRMGAEIREELQKILKRRGLSTAVGDEGGFAPDLQDAAEALSLLVEAIQKSGYEPGQDVSLALDVAASELYDKEFKKYVFDGEGRAKGEKVIRSAEEMIDYYGELLASYPIVSIEDPLDEEDWEGWELLTTRLGREIQLVGDDLFVTNKERMLYGISRGIANAVLIKPNQIGTVTETLEAVTEAKRAGYGYIISHRSGETEDTFIADLSVACGGGQIKTGAPCRGERTAKYNRLLRIEEELSGAAGWPEGLFKNLPR